MGTTTNDRGLREQAILTLQRLGDEITEAAIQRAIRSLAYFKTLPEEKLNEIIERATKEGLLDEV